MVLALRVLPQLAITSPPALVAVAHEPPRIALVANSLRCWAIQQFPAELLQQRPQVAWETFNHFLQVAVPAALAPSVPRPVSRALTAGLAVVEVVVAAAITLLARRVVLVAAVVTG